MDSIIFDVDGTLWDATETVALSWNRAIRENSNLEIHIDGAVLAGVFGKTMTEIGDILFPSLPEDERAKLLDQCFVYENRLLETTPGRLYPHVYETIRLLSKRYPLFIVSNCQCGYIEVMEKTTGIGEFIKDTLCFGQTRKCKADTIRLLMEKNSLSSPVYVGDTKGDQTACQQAGIPFIHAAYGFGADVEAVCRIQQFSDLPSLLEKMDR